MPYILFGGLDSSSSVWMEPGEMGACLPGCREEPDQGTLQERRVFPSLLPCAQDEPMAFPSAWASSQWGRLKLLLETGQQHAQVLWASEQACSWAPSLFSSSFNPCLMLLFILSIFALLCHNFFFFFSLFLAAYGSIGLHFCHFRQLAPLALLLKMSFKFSLSIWVLGVKAAGGSQSDLSKTKHATTSQILAFRW